MIMLQLSSNTGPEECCLAVHKALARLTQEAAQLTVRVDVIEQVPGNTVDTCLLYTSPSPRDRQKSRMPSSA